MVLLVANELLDLIKRKASAIEIANWTYDVYHTYDDEFSCNGDNTINRLMMLEEGDEFEMTEDQLLEIVKKLKSDS